LKQKAAVTWTP
jgi:hypothetical protein